MTNIHMISHAESCGATLRCCDSLNAGLLPCTSSHLGIISRSPVCTVLAMHGLRQIEAPARPSGPRHGAVQRKASMSEAPGAGSSAQ